MHMYYVYVLFPNVLSTSHAVEGALSASPSLSLHPPLSLSLSLALSRSLSLSLALSVSRALGLCLGHVSVPIVCRRASASLPCVWYVVFAQELIPFRSCKHVSTQRSL